ncbi:DUF1281 family ferredoxin-like fold protein [Frigoriglobus tundricola]|uniref:Uncharacterized protein n=1 Tax=Frigoriglobus tundricola TaxID=2774151 RepID=A0A6M5Z3V4_9BACT|nr:hypothetical protein [Frigoriglobus tundricola]QJX01100.1 hypothetical protein FTUN_8739 [Frigoriglobus tundricola]
MPNWCRCEVEVSGRAERVREFLEFAKGDGDGRETVFDFNRFVPYPPEWRKLDEAFYAWLESNPDLSGGFPVHAYDKWGYLWCCRNWGTNSNATEPRYGDATEAAGTLTASVHFETAWCEPWPVVLKASELFPDLAFELHYFEPLGDFAGCYRCSAGVGTDECWACDHVEVDRVPDC